MVVLQWARPNALPPPPVLLATQAQRRTAAFGHGAGLGVDVLRMDLDGNGATEPALDQRADGRCDELEIVLNRVVRPQAVMTAPVAKRYAVNSRSANDQELPLRLFNNLIGRDD